MYQNLTYEELLKIIAELKVENNALKAKLSQYTQSEELHADTTSNSNVSNEEKLKIFMKVFAARTDVYAKKWKSNITGKTGYSPVCKNEFSKYKCAKPKVKCSECVYRELLPLTEDVVMKHLKGEITIGIYPLLQEDKCNFLAIDFDKATYEKDAVAFWNTCDELRVPVYVERSQSGNGAHIWIFFNDSISAKLARKLGTILLTKTMEKSALSLDSYDRLFPNQDTLPKGGFGNLIAMPFQGKCSKEGNTVFVNKYFEPYENQFEILKTIKRMNLEEVLNIASKYESLDYKEPELEEDEDELPKKNIKEENVKFQSDVECILDNEIYIKKLKLLPNEVTYLKRLASFNNPKFFELQRLRMPVYNTPRLIMCFEEDDRYLILPRGCLDEIEKICDDSNVKLKIKDMRQVGFKCDFNFIGKLSTRQTRAMNELLQYDTGVLCAATSFGKTVVASKVISEKNTSTLVLVNRTTLLEQWKEKLSYFLDIPKKEIGQIGAGKNNQTKVLDVASLQTLYRQDNIEKILENYGLVIVDECHHISAFSFEDVLKKIHAKNVYGLTATPIRKDGHHPIIYMQCGKIRHKVSAKELKQNKKMEHTVIVKKTDYVYIKPDESEKLRITEVLNDMANSEYRNNLIVQDIGRAIKEGRVPLILTERVEHLDIIKEKLQLLGVNVPIIIYRSGMGKKQRESINKQIKEADENNLSRIIIATSTSIGEGFDDSRLDTLFLTMPVSWKGRIIQYVGRLHREHIDKDKVVVYDYVDDMRVLTKMYERRKRGYKAAGYSIEE